MGTTESNSIRGIANSVFNTISNSQKKTPWVVLGEHNGKFSKIQNFYFSEVKS